MAKILTSDVRRALDASARSKGEICRSLGWVQADGRADYARLRRSLGIQPDVSVHTLADGRTVRYESRRLHLDDKLAADILLAADIDPVDAGL